jgi:hypothetical protein
MKVTRHEIECHPEGITLEAAMLRVMTPDEREAWHRAHDPQRISPVLHFPGDKANVELNRPGFPLFPLLFVISVPFRRWELEFIEPRVEQDADRSSSPKEVVLEW